LGELRASGSFACAQDDGKNNDGLANPAVRAFDFHCMKNEIDLGAMSAQSKTAISTKEAPAAIGPYSQAVRVGDMLFASGQVALDPATGQLVGGGIAEQTVRVLENVKAVLGKAGLDMVHVVKTTVFLKSMGDFAAMNEVYARYLAPEGVVPPARSTVAVAGLPKDALVEIEVIAKDASGE
jgi:2-iminobutanoate/2-iminopropanoate deaminase